MQLCPNRKVLEVTWANGMSIELNFVRYSKSSDTGGYLLFRETVAWYLLNGRYHFHLLRSAFKVRRCRESPNSSLPQFRTRWQLRECYVVLRSGVCLAFCLTWCPVCIIVHRTYHCCRSATSIPSGRESISTTPHTMQSENIIVRLFIYEAANQFL